MKKHSMLMISAAALLLVGCGNATQDSSSKPASNNKDESSSGALVESSIGGDSSSSSSVDDKHASFEDFAKIIEKAANKEAFRCNAASDIETSIAGSIKDVVSKNLVVSADSYSLATGSLRTYVGDVLSVEDEITEIRSINDFKYIIGERDYTTKMYYSVTDYANDASAKYAYQDSASRVYVVKNEMEIGDLSEGSYLFDDQAEYALTFKHTTYLLNFLDSYFYANPYAEQVGCINVDKEALDKDTFKYSVSCAYELEGDLNDVQKVNISLDATFDEKGERLVSFSTSYSEDDINKANKDDHRLTVLERSGTLEYDNRVNKAKDAPKAEDYFLASVDSVELVGTDRKPVDPTKVSPANSYIFLQPKTYSPAKAIGVNEYTINPVSSSNPEAVKVEHATSGANYFVVAGEGAATLTYSYVGIDSNGYYREIEKTYDVVVRDYEEPAKVSAASIFDNRTGDIVSKKDGKVEVETKNSYHCIVNVVSASGSPNKVPQGVNIVVSDEKKVSCSFADKTLTFTPLEEGTVTIRIESKENPDVYCEIVLVIHDNSAVSIPDLLVANSWKYTSLYSSTTYTMTFSADGTGKFVDDNGEGKVYNETFKWKYENNQLLLTDWSYEYKMFKVGTMTADNGAISFYYEPTYATYLFMKEGK